MCGRKLTRGTPQKSLHTSSASFFNAGLESLQSGRRVEQVPHIDVVNTAVHEYQINRAAVAVMRYSLVKLLINSWRIRWHLAVAGIKSALTGCGFNCRARMRLDFFPHWPSGRILQPTLNPPPDFTLLL